MRKVIDKRQVEEIQYTSTEFPEVDKTNGQNKCLKIKLENFSEIKGDLNPYMKKLLFNWEN